MRLLAHLFRLGISGIFLAAGTLKLLDPAGFSRDVAEYGILSGSLATAFAHVLLPVEVAVGTALLISYRRILSLWVATGLMLVFIGAIGYAIITDQPIHGCGCFGSTAPRTPAQTLAEDVGFLAAGAFSILVLRRDARDGARATGGPWKGRAVIGVAVLSAVFMFLSPRLPLDDVATRLRAHVSWADLEIPIVEVDLTRGRHLVAILDLENGPTDLDLEALNELAAAGTSVVGLYEEDESRFSAFFWERGPAFPLYHVAPSELRTLYRTRPRYFGLDEGRVIETWEAPPSASEVEAASRRVRS